MPFLLQYFQQCLFWNKKLMRLYAYQSNQRFRDIRKKQFHLHSQQKLVFRELVSHNASPDFKENDFYRTVVYGVPSEFRAMVWNSLICNPYNITNLFYNSILTHWHQHQKIQEEQKKNNSNQEGMSTDRSSIATIDADGRGLGMETEANFEEEERPDKLMVIRDRIEKDLPRTFPELKNLHEDPEEYKKLTRILGAVAIAREDIGYIQGMSHIVSLLLLQLNDEFQSFLAMMTMLSTNPLNDFFTFNQTMIFGFSNRVSERVKKLSPEVWDLLTAHEIDMKMLVVNWVMTMFSRCFQLDSILNVWDILLANNLNHSIMIQLCAAVIVARKKALFDCQDSSRMAKMFIHDKLDLIQQESVLEYLRGLAKTQ